MKVLGKVQKENQGYWAKEKRVDWVRFGNTGRGRVASEQTGSL